MRARDLRLGPSPACLALLLSLGVLACAGEGSHGLRLVFPDQQARELTTQVHLWALEPGGEGCAGLVAGSLRPDELTRRAELQAAYPPGPEALSLGQVPTGELLFFAQALTEDGALILRGCTQVTVEAGGDLQVEIQLGWVCHPDPAGELPRNDLDDDCDGQTDECLEDADCEDENPCTADFCAGEECHPRALPDGLGCTDGNPCTTGDACLAGVCSGAERDCSDLDGDCLLGRCDPENGDCVTQPRIDGLTCDDSRSCTGFDACYAGVCAGTLLACDDGDACTQDRCEEATGECLHVQTSLPGAEGPQGDATCANGLDDDCDTLVDGEDPNCNACAQDSDCDDQNACTADVCAGGCNNLPRADGFECDDGLFCTDGDRCEAGVCVASPRDCSGLNDACRLGVCQEAQRACVAVDRADGSACDDGLYCGVGDRCLAGACSPAGARDCDDSDFCTLDACSEAQDQCQHTPDPDPDQEGPQGNDTCLNGQDDDCDGLTDLGDPGCLGCATNQDCEDGNPCTQDTCQAGDCRADPAPAGTPCDDLDPCTMDDGCAGLVCLGAPLDADGDGHLAAACGGYDCDDADPAVSPDGQEGPAGDASCLGGVDEDCDGLTDQGEIDCWQPSCSPDGWCWENPLPQGDGLWGVHGFAADDVWVVGQHGRLLHWDGQSFASFWGGTTHRLYDVWGAAPNAVWAVGEEGSVCRWNGTSWSHSSQAGGYWLYGLHGFAANQLVAVGAGGTVIRWNGTSWAQSTASTSQRLLDVWGPSMDELWAVGVAGTIRRWNGTSWLTEASGTNEELSGVWGTPGGEVWAVSSLGKLFRRRPADGVWENVPSPTDLPLYGIQGTGADDVWATGYTVALHKDANGWALASPAGERGWFSMQAGDLQRVWARSPDDVWTVGSAGRVLRRGPAGWTALTRGHGSRLRDVWMDDSRAWAVGDGGAVLRWEAGHGGWEREPSGASADLYGLCRAGDGSAEMLAVGAGGAILRRDPQTAAWTLEDSGTAVTLRDVECPGADLAWAVGDEGTILAWDGASWQPEPSGAAGGLRALDVGVDGSMLAVGDAGLLVYRLSAAAPWQADNLGTAVDLLGVWSLDVSTALLVGRDGLLLYWDGTEWLDSGTGVTGEDLNAVWSDSPTNAWAAGRRGALLHWDGSTWEPVISGTSNSLYALGVAPAGRLRLVGEAGTILVHDPE